MPSKRVFTAYGKSSNGGQVFIFGRMAAGASVEKRVIPAFLAIVFDEVILLKRRFEPFGCLFQDQASDIKLLLTGATKSHIQ